MSSSDSEDEGYIEDIKEWVNYTTFMVCTTKTTHLISGMPKRILEDSRHERPVCMTRWPEFDFKGSKR
jgi:hypothetical protein